MRTPAGHILVVDDDASFRELLAEVIAQEGHVVDAVGDGREALLLLERSRIDVAIVDVVMPRLDGATLVHVMSRDPTLKHIPVIAMSGGEDLDVPEATLMLQKPIDLEQLRTQLARVWGALLARRAAQIAL